uniref:Phage tail assembly chaperone protein, E, or 41 or 14 n=1 Tax=Candidatus Kentrum sp. LFY TaxID=2126342 RepID=A0A450W6P6_9GAMM|nr:MAG: Phage tail assembly chaperone protein, E, or 41 or 14 [Candidatus Kentron sp. LFY]
MPNTFQAGNSATKVDKTGQASGTDLKESIIDLAFPVEHNGVKYDKLTMRRPKMRDLMLAEDASGVTFQAGRGVPIKTEGHVFSYVCAVPVEVIYETDMSDYQKLQQTYSRFLS